MGNLLRDRAFCKMIFDPSGILCHNGSGGECRLEKENADLFALKLSLQYHVGIRDGIHRKIPYGPAIVLRMNPNAPLRSIRRELFTTAKAFKENILRESHPDFFAVFK